MFENKSEYEPWLARHTSGQEVGRCRTQRWIWGIHFTLVTKHANEGIHPGFEAQGKRQQKATNGYQWVFRKDSFKLLNFKKKEKKRVYLFGVNVVRYIVGDKYNVECFWSVCKCTCKYYTHDICTCRKGKEKIKIWLEAMCFGALWGHAVYHDYTSCLWTEGRGGWGVKMRMEEQSRVAYLMWNKRVTGL